VRWLVYRDERGDLPISRVYQGVSFADRRLATAGTRRAGLAAGGAMVGRNGLCGEKPKGPLPRTKKQGAWTRMCCDRDGVRGKAFRYEIQPDGTRPKRPRQRHFGTHCGSMSSRPPAGDEWAEGLSARKGAHTSYAPGGNSGILKPLAATTPRSSSRFGLFADSVVSMPIWPALLEPLKTVPSETTYFSVPHYWRPQRGAVRHLGLGSLVHPGVWIICQPTPAPRGPARAEGQHRFN